jgi:hypothetical protein
LASYDFVRLDARLAHLKSVENIRTSRESSRPAGADRPGIVEHGDVVVAMRSGPTASRDEMDRCEQAPISLQELQSEPPLPPQSDRGVFWPRAVAFLIACAIAAPLSYYFVTSPSHKHPIEASAMPLPATQIASGLPVQSATPEMLGGFVASVAVTQSAPVQQGALTHEPAFERPEPPRSPPTTTGVAEGRGRSSAPDRASVSATKTANSEEVKLLIDRGNHFFETGDLISARILFTRAANAGDAAAAVAIGATYDPVVLANRGVRGVAADLEKARSWYERAKEMGSPEGRRRLEILPNRQHSLGPL